MLRVALSGGIASGKTTVSNTFAALGVPVIDADVLSRQAVAANTPGLAKIQHRFGDNILNSQGTLDRKALRDIVFSDPQARTDLEAIIHPEVRRLTQESLENFSTQGAPYCLVVIPLLVETNQQESYDHVVIVDVSAETQFERLMQRDGSNEEQARNILASQATREQRLAIADDVITNTGTLKDLKEKVTKLHRKLSLKAELKSDTPR